MEKCLNCGTEFTGKYCPECGQKVISRLTLRYIVDNTAGHILSYDNSFFHTVGALIIRPGVVLSGFISGKRHHYFEPFKFLLLTTTLTSIALLGLPGADGVLDLQTQQASVSVDFNDGEISGLFQTMLKRYYTVLLFLTIPTGALINWALFRKMKYNLAEHLVVITYATGIANLINTPLYLLTFLDRQVFLVIAAVGGILPFLYFIWYYIKVYREGIFLGIVKTLISSFLNMFIYTLILLGIFLVYYKLFK